MKTMFNAEESNLICIFASESKAFTLESRSEVIEDIERALPYLEASYLTELSHRVIGRLRNMTDEEFEQLELTAAE